MWDMKMYHSTRNDCIFEPSFADDICMNVVPTGCPSQCIWVDQGAPTTASVLPHIGWVLQAIATPHKLSPQGSKQRARA